MRDCGEKKARMGHECPEIMPPDLIFFQKES